MSKEDKNKKIGQTQKETKDRRKSMLCITRIVKIDKSHLSAKQRESLKLLFVEAKWLYNHLLASGEDLFKVDTSKIHQTINLDKNKKKVTHNLTVIGSQIKQALVERMLSNIKGLSATKKKGRKIGGFKFKSMIGSLDLKQPNVTFSIKGKNQIKVQGIKKPLKVRGLHQIPINCEIGCAKITQSAGDYFIHITYFIKPEDDTRKKPVDTKDAIGMDFGIADDMTLSNGTTINVKQDVSKRRRKQCKKVSKTKKGSSNRFKQRIKLQKAYRIEGNRKEEIRNKIINHFKNNYALVGVQDENIKGWQAGLFGKQINRSSIGGIIAGIKKLPNTQTVDRFFPSTQRCMKCHHLTKIGLDERIYICENCGHTEKRDKHSGQNVLDESISQIPTERRNFKPVETATSALDTLEAQCKLLSVKQEAPQL